MYSEDQLEATSGTADEGIRYPVAKSVSLSIMASTGAESQVASQVTSDEDAFRASFAVASHRGAIFAAYNGGLGPILETARACLEAEIQLDPAQKQALLRDLPFSKATFSKFVSIGRDSRLYDPEIRHQLPPKFTVLYLLSLLSNQDFDELVQQGTLRCGLRRSELEQWIKVRGEFKIGKPRLSKLARAFAAAFKPTSVLYLDNEEEFRRRLSTLAAEFGMEVVFPPDKYMTDWDQALQYIREECRKVVDQFRNQKRQKLKSYGGKIAPYIRKNPATAFGDIWIDPTDDIHRMQAVLARIGREKEFGLIRAAAFGAYGIADVSDERSAPQDASAGTEAVSAEEQQNWTEKDESSI